MESGKVDNDGAEWRHFSAVEASSSAVGVASSRRMPCSHAMLTATVLVRSSLPAVFGSCRVLGSISPIFYLIQDGCTYDPTLNRPSAHVQGTITPQQSEEATRDTPVLEGYESALPALYHQATDLH